MPQYNKLSVEDLDVKGKRVFVRVDFLRPQIFHHLDRALAKNVFLENVGQTGLRVNGKDQHFFALQRKPVRGSGGEGCFPQTAFAAEHDVAAVGIFEKNVFERHR